LNTYFLESNHIGFSTWSNTDLELALRLWGDSEVTKFIGGPFNEEQIKERLLQEIVTLQTYNVQYWPIFLLDTNEHIGCCGLRPYKPGENIYEIGIHIKSIYWNKGYAFEAMQAIAEYAFTILRVAGLFARFDPLNQMSMKILVKLGFQYVDDYSSPNGKSHPTYMLWRNKDS